MQTIAQIRLQKFIHAQMAEQSRRKAGRHDTILEMQERERLFMEKTKPFLTNEGVREAYGQWMKGYIEQGRMPHMYLNFPMIINRFFVVKDHIFLPPLYGTAAVNLIVPDHLVVTFTELGHNAVYTMRNFEAHGHVIVYSDTMTYIRENDVHS